MKVDYSKYIDKVKFWKQTIENAKNFTGTSPPSLFVGRAFYPRVFVGLLSPPQHKENAEVLDSPEIWYKQQANISQILNFRGQMIYSRFRSAVKQPQGKLIETTQEVAMAKNPADIEVELRKQPKFRMIFDSWAQPVGSPALVESVRLTENPHVESKVDYVTSDNDLKAQNAVSELYRHGLQVSRIQKIFSAGLLGTKLQRKLVPTRWSITAVDDLVGKSIVEKVKDYQEISEFMLFSNEYLGNHYEILLIPGTYQYELIESWTNDFGVPTLSADYERYWLRESYATGTHGAFYAGRLAVAEFLEKIKRQAAVLIVREISPEYDIPVGIWQLRETVRGAFNKSYEKFDNLESAVQKICERVRVGNKWKVKSLLLRDLRNQNTLTSFLKRL